MIYSNLLRPILFRMDAEAAHHFTMNQLTIMPPSLLKMMFRKPKSSVKHELFGLTFENRVGLAAGLDKNGVALPAWAAMGFGFVEIGTITAHAQPGNPQPRLFRYPEQKALVNRMGFNNDGAKVVAARLRDLKDSGDWPKIPVGVNIGKSKITPNEEAALDYLQSFRLLRNYGDYFVINVSSPNTAGLRELQAAESLSVIVKTLRDEDAEKPFLVKIAPDLADEQAVEIAKLAEKEGLAGIIATNTTLDHSSLPTGRDETGGLSGAPLRERATRLLKVLKEETKLPIIASGGVMNAEAAKEKFDAGASLVQIYTGFIYRGPELIREIGQAVD